MKIILLIIIVILGIVTLADSSDEDDPEPKKITEEIGIILEHCHAGDLAIIHVTPIPKNAIRKSGFFTTTNNVLSLSNELSMLHDGLNRLEIQTICRGMTSEIHSVVYDIIRPPPKPKIDFKLLNEDINNIQPPPIPQVESTIIPKLMPLPNAETNFGTYKDLEMMKKYFEKGKRK